MKPPLWMDRATTLAIHDMMMAEHGGLAGVRDEGMLESALGRPENLFHYGTPTLPEMAAAYAFGIIRNHPFNDGNKRTGFLVAATFLEVNGLNFFATEESVVVSTLALAAQEWDEAAYARWLSENSAPPA
jgi:death-on-curing protein